MKDLIKEKLDIAERAGKLHQELSGLFHSKQLIQKKKDCRESLRVITSGQESFDSGRIDNYGSELHDLVIQYLDKQIQIREIALDELIKVLK